MTRHSTESIENGVTQPKNQETPTAAPGCGAECFERRSLERNGQSRVCVEELKDAKSVSQNTHNLKRRLSNPSLITPCPVFTSRSVTQNTPYSNATETGVFPAKSRDSQRPQNAQNSSPLADDLAVLLEERLGAQLGRSQDVRRLAEDLAARVERRASAVRVLDAFGESSHLAECAEPNCSMCAAVSAALEVTMSQTQIVQLLTAKKASAVVFDDAAPLGFFRHRVLMWALVSWTDTRPGAGRAELRAILPVLDLGRGPRAVCFPGFGPDDLANDCLLGVETGGRLVWSEAVADRRRARQVAR